MARLTPEEAATKHATRLKGAHADIQKGVERVTSSPGAAAAKKVDKMRANLLKKIDDGTWVKKVSAYPLEDWKTDMIQKGLANIDIGIERAHDKQVKFFSELLPFQDSLRTTVKAMPDMTIEDSVQRAATWIRGMGKFKKS